MKAMKVPSQDMIPETYRQPWVQEVEKLIKQGNTDGERTTRWETIQDILVMHGVAQRGVQIPPEFCGVSPFNRSKLGVGGSESQVHGDEVLQDGFSWKKSADATCSETAPHPYNESALSFNNLLEKRSQDLIPPLKALKVESVGGSHTNTFLRQVKAGVRCTVTKLASPSGHLDMEALTAHRPSFKEAVTNGMKWFKLDWPCQYVWPDLLAFIQNTLNTNAQTGQGEIEMMMYMDGEREVCKQRGEEVDWPSIIQRAKSSLPKCAPYLHIIAKYINKCESPELIEDLSKFIKTFACSEKGALRTLGGEYIAKVVSLDWGLAMECPRVLTACLQGNLA